LDSGVKPNRFSRIEELSGFSPPDVDAVPFVAIKREIDDLQRFALSQITFTLSLP
jgi:hypothetical protein